MYDHLAKATLLSCFLLHPTVQAQSSSQLQPILSISSYEDQEVGFSMAIPTGWQKITAIASEEPNSETGYSVGFESPKSGPTDLFADYIMVEVLPGSYSGAFETSGEKRHEMLIDGETAVVDELVLENIDINDTKLNLMVYQAEIQLLGYTVGLYAIGEQKESEVLFDAFKLLLHTYSVPINPFDVS